MKKKKVDSISWNKEGNSLIISDVNKFSNEILSKYFNHIKYKSFIRLL